MKFLNKVAIVTGSNQGIGKEIARALSIEGAQVMLHGRDKEKLEATSKELSLENSRLGFISGDLSNKKDCQIIIDETIKKFGRLDFLINNAAFASEGNIEDTSIDVFESIFSVNLNAQMYLSQLAIPHIKSTKGSIVFSGSIAGFIGLPGYSAYSITKAALSTFTEALRTELSVYDIHVGIIYIGFTENAETKTFIDADGNIKPIPQRKGVKKLSSQFVAKKFVSMIHRRKNQKVLSPLGKTLFFFKRIFPKLSIFILTLIYKKRNKSI